MSSCLRGAMRGGKKKRKEKKKKEKEKEKRVTKDSFKRLTKKLIDERERGEIVRIDASRILTAIIIFDELIISMYK